MTGSKIPRYLLFGSVLGVAVTIIMLSMFYGQYHLLARSVIADSSADHSSYLQSNMQRQAQADMQHIAYWFTRRVAADDAPTVQQTLDLLLREHEYLSGLKYTDMNGASLQAGEWPSSSVEANQSWQDEYLLASVPVPDQSGSSMSGAFSLADLQAESAAFVSQLERNELDRRRVSYLWIGLGTFATLMACAAIVALIARDQTRRIRDLKYQAQKLRDADFGEPIAERRGDELGSLAAVFNEMRDELRSTTISRDYLDNVLSSMNDAIIITTHEGKIKRINKATTHLLGYDESELEDTSIDYIVDTKKSPALADDSTAGLPKDAFFESKFGESIPVSYTCSILESSESESGDRIYAAQNTTERRRAEQRIRYLARIDALTKIPNRMQFQHLLQRGIARARRSNRSLSFLH